MKVLLHRSRIYVPLDIHLCIAIADAYEDSVSDPFHPDVRQVYDAFVDETIDQYVSALFDGITFEPWMCAGQPYNDSLAMRQDVEQNDHLYFFRGGDMPPEHPMSRLSNKRAGGYPLSCNELFRAVHDLYGHAMEHFSFGPRGEENAWRAHSQMYSATARVAMTAETRAQSCWVNFGRHLRRSNGSLPAEGEFDYVPLHARPYAPQKAVILPDFCWTSHGNGADTSGHHSS
jgi:hypothetical protein